MMNKPVVISAKTPERPVNEINLAQAAKELEGAATTPHALRTGEVTFTTEAVLKIAQLIKLLDDDR